MLKFLVLFMRFDQDDLGLLIVTRFYNRDNYVGGRHGWHYSHFWSYPSIMSPASESQFLVKQISFKRADGKSTSLCLWLDQVHYRRSVPVKFACPSSRSLQAFTRALRLILSDYCGAVSAAESDSGFGFELSGGCTLFGRSPCASFLNWE